MFWLPIAAMLAGTAVNIAAQRRVQAEQQRIMQEGRARTGRLQDEALDRAMTEANRFDADKRGQDEGEIVNQQTAQFENAAKPIDAQGVEIGKTVEGGADYQKAKADNAIKTAQSLRALAQAMGRLGGASALRQNEAVRYGDTVNDIANKGRYANAMSSIDQMQAQSVQPNAFAQLAGSALSSYGAGSLMSGGLGGGGGQPYSLSGVMSNPVDPRVIQMPRFR